MLIAGHILAQEVDDRKHLLAAHDFGMGQILGPGAIYGNDVGHVHGHHAGNGALVEQHMPGGMRQKRLGQRLQLALFGLHRGFEASGEHRAFHIHAGDLEHQRGGLHAAVALAADVVLHTGERGNVAIAGGIDDDPGQNGAAAGFVLHDHAFDGVTFHDRLGGEGVHEHVGAGFFQHLDPGKDVVARIDLHGTFALAKVIFQGVFMQHFFVEPAVHGAGVVAHHAGGAHAAGRVQGVHQQRLRAQAGGHDRRGAARRTGAQNQNIYFPADRNLNGRERKIYGIVHRVHTPCGK